MQFRRPDFWPTVGAVLATLLFARLGFWQLHRAAEAKALRQAYEARVHAAPESPPAGLWDAEAMRFRQVSVRGRYEPRFQILLDNQFHGSSVGYEVLTPLRIAGSDYRVLVNRGWIPAGRTRQQLPQVATPAGVQHIVGLAVVPDRYFRLGRPHPAHPWHTLWEYLDLRHYGAAVPFRIEPVVLLLSPASPAGGFVRHWPRAGAGVAMHQGYALQWFLFALSVVAIYLVVNRPRHGHDPKKPR